MSSRPLRIAIEEIHSRAVEISSRYKRTEVELVEVLQEIEEHRVYLVRGHASLYAYVTSELGLSESTAYNLITVARKAREVPELKAQLQQGRITLSNARRVATVLTPGNQNEWLQKARDLSNRALEKEIVRFRPQEATPERTSYVTEDRMKLEVGLSEAEMLKLRRVQDLLSQSQKRAVTLEETLQVLTSEFLRKHDPIQKAERAQARKLEAGKAKTGKTEPRRPQLVTRRVAGRRHSASIPTGNHQPARPARASIPSAIRHGIHLRDQGSCTFMFANGNRCGQSRWIEFHHKTPVNQGGTDATENLVTLCWAHHRYQHLAKEDDHLVIK